MDDLVEKIRSGHFKRAAILTLRNNAVQRLNKDPDDQRALEVREVIDTTQVPKLLSEYIFMGFMPGADSDRAIDDKWYSEGVCTFDFYEDENQTEDFYEILPGDMLITKKNLIATGEMEIYAYGYVTECVDSPHSNKRWLKVDWKHPSEFIRVPSMGCTRTVNPRSLEMVDEKMPGEFWEWLDIASED